MSMHGSAEVRPITALGAGRPGFAYRAQRFYVGVMMWLVGRLLQASSAVDPVVRGEVSQLPAGFTFAMRVRPGRPGFAMGEKDGQLRLQSLDKTEPLHLSFDFKHCTHAFLVLGFIEGTATSFARDRMSVDGNLGAGMKIVRCLNRMEAIVLPKFIARRAIKAYPEIGFGEKLMAAARIYLRLLIQLVGGK
jgi:hypothetical protein